MILCPNCGSTDLTETMAPISRLWFKCNTCEKQLSFRIQEPRGERTRGVAREEELVECHGEIKC